ncbi:transcriptional regulator, LacI family [Actinacidiphila yanglinensis]|uniref:Transcriptional regulator, LacI family n=1 Tax=Actinacidiphila yanglinensis TaxID=310779 RepID=A0A1H6D4S5_9ACTN|nr:LacI family DNA-binding transcriptional regulator [Actinacidiphila yanglinensis]SEG80369.1 transcriptional regulator, LacI family [Actinacidiphila yanglinensis]
MTTSAAGPPTVETIAARAGVSIASVSRVLNGHGARPNTVRRVEQAAAELGYVPNGVARSLKGGRTRQLTFAMPDVGNPVYVSMVRQIQATAKPLGYRLLLHSTDAVAEDELDVVRSLADRTSDGLILVPIRVTGEHLDVMAAAARPVVVIGSLPDEAPVDSVRADSVSGTLLAMRHLLASGRRRTAFINGPADTVPGRNRSLGYRTALAEAGLEHDPALTVTTEFDISAGAAAMHRLLDAAPGIDSVFCANDQLALGAVHAAHDRGLRIPEDLAVAGMDNSELARASHPALTSVDLGSAERGRIAAEMLLSRLDGEDHDVRCETVAARLVVRGSTAYDQPDYDHDRDRASDPRAHPDPDPGRRRGAGSGTTATSASASVSAS